MTPVIVGHRANSGRIASWYRRLGVKWVEVDVYWDGSLIVIGHPRSPVKRASILGSFFAEIDYYFFYRNSFYGKHGLLEWVERWLSFAQGVIIDVKGFIPIDELGRVVARIADQREIIVTSGDHPYLLRVKKEYSWIKTGVSLPIKPIDPVRLVEDAEADYVSIIYSFLDGELVAEFRRAGIGVAVWTVNDYRTARYIAGLGVDLIISDRPDLAMRGAREAAMGAAKTP